MQEVRMGDFVAFHDYFWEGNGRGVTHGLSPLSGLKQRKKDFLSGGFWERKSKKVLRATYDLRNDLNARLSGGKGPFFRKKAKSFEPARIERESPPIF